MLKRAFDKTHFAQSAQPSDGRVKLGSLWSDSDTFELYICTQITPSIAFTLLTGGSGAPVGSKYIIIGPADGTLTDERILTAGSGITITDGGAGSTVTIEASGAAAAAAMGRTFLLMGA